MTKTEQIRLKTWRLKVLQYAAERPRNVARTCRHFGISRRAFYKWKQRYDAYGEVGLYDRSRTPRHSPRAVPDLCPLGMQPRWVQIPTTMSNSSR